MTFELRVLTVAVMIVLLNDRTCWLIADMSVTLSTQHTTWCHCTVSSSRWFFQSKNWHYWA